jgi:hypothetical protein
MTLSTHINNALSSAKAYAAAIESARKDAKGMTRDAVRTAILPVVASFYAVPVKAGEGKAEGTKVMDKDATKYETARKALQRLLSDICPSESSGKKEVVAAPKALLKKVTSEIIEAGITKAEFDALIAELRASVSFK